MFDNHIFTKYDYLIYTFKNAFVSKFEFFNHTQWFLNHDINFKISRHLFKKTVRWYRGNGWRTFFYKKFHNGYHLRNFANFRKLVKFRSKKKKKSKKKKISNYEKKQKSIQKKTNNYFFFKNLNYKNIVF